jgi:hypothetical protein
MMPFSPDTVWYAHSDGANIKSRYTHIFQGRSDLIRGSLACNIQGIAASRQRFLHDINVMLPGNEFRVLISGDLYHPHERLPCPDERLIDVIRATLIHVQHRLD